MRDRKNNSSSSLGPRAPSPANAPQARSLSEESFGEVQFFFALRAHLRARAPAAPEKSLSGIADSCSYLLLLPSAYCLLSPGAPGVIVALKTSLRVLRPRLSSLEISLVLSKVILKPASFEPLVTAPRQA